MVKPPITAQVNSSPILPNQSQRSSFAVIGYAEAGRGRKSAMTHWRVVCCNVEDLNFGMQNLRPSNVKVIFQRPSCGSPDSGGFRFHCRYCPCGTADVHLATRQTDWPTGMRFLTRLLPDRQICRQAFSDQVATNVYLCWHCWLAGSYGNIYVACTVL